MTTPSKPMRSSSYLSTASQATDAGSGSVRPRNRRLISTGDPQASTDPAPSNRNSGLLSAFSPSSSRSTSPLSFGRFNIDNGSTGNLGQFLNESLTQSWSSVQGLATSLITATDGSAKSSRSSSRPAIWGRQSTAGGKSKTSSAWGPAPPSQPPQLNDVAAGSLAERDAALKAAKKASVLESHDGVNGGLDVSGKHKRRTSDEVLPQNPPPQEDVLVYIHKVQTNDTYAGLVLRYRCREDAFKKANGLWSRDSVQTRKWLLFPVDACEIRGRPCDPPSWHNSHSVDLLAPTPMAVAESRNGPGATDDFFSRPVKSETTEPVRQDEDKPWTHVRWVAVESFNSPVEIGRVSRHSIGYFPPRRKKSIRTASSLSTPRQSFELPSTAPGSAEGRSRRRSSMSNRPQIGGTPTSTRSRMGSDAADGRPAWMKRPGGVGSMGRNVRMPGPDKDALNSWTSKHLPGLNMEGPSMSIMGSDTAHFGFKKGTTELVESSFEDGREAIPAGSQQGISLDKAAAAVETWLRGALARRSSTPLVSTSNTSRHNANPLALDRVDSIELVDTYSDDGRAPREEFGSLLFDSRAPGSTARSNGESTIRGRTMASGTKGRKDD
ncbi:hypothetical protein B0I35DRAFT_415953 [Stachybotrys elegans]|uniref:LysM domain-containing protein n=1 Tax=Stachybotrys elegans TaxID=80388 RepID=A0A8K0T089_9HYPO|nr:hypothetical protein B0I35DRAFT_415953 [Stachybotrys elegans]